MGSLETEKILQKKPEKGALKPVGNDDDLMISLRLTEPKIPTVHMESILR